MKRASIISVILFLFLTGSVHIHAQEKNKSGFSDVPETHWAYSYIQDMADRGVISGYEDGTFKPDAKVTRAEFSKMMVAAAGIKTEKPSKMMFFDVELGKWYTPYVHAASEFIMSEIVTNRGNLFKPQEEARREDVAVALVRLKGYSVGMADVSKLFETFSDCEDITYYPRSYVAVAVEKGIISGFDDGTFRPKEGITRAQAATLLSRITTDENGNPITINTNCATTKKLADANIQNSSYSTMDEDNNIFYVDSEDNCVYKIEIPSGKKTKYYDPNVLSYEETNMTDMEGNVVEGTTKASSFVGTQVFYNEKSDELLLVGHYEQLELESKGVSEGKYNAVYNITDTSKVTGKLYYDYLEMYKYHHQFSIQMALDKDNVYIWGYEWVRGIYYEPNSRAHHLNLKTGIMSDTNIYYFDNETLGIIEHEDGIYSICGDRIHNYNYKTEENEKVIDDLWFWRYGIKDGYIYYIQKGAEAKDSSMKEIREYVVNYKNNPDELKEIQISRTFNVDEKDKKYAGMTERQWREVHRQFFVIDDNTFVIYDGGEKAFKLLEI